MDVKTMDESQNWTERPQELGFVRLLLSMVLKEEARTPTAFLQEYSQTDSINSAVISAFTALKTLLLLLNIL